MVRQAGGISWIRTRERSFLLHLYEKRANRIFFFSGFWWCFWADMVIHTGFACGLCSFYDLPPRVMSEWEAGDWARIHKKIFFFPEIMIWFMLVVQLKAWVVILQKNYKWKSGNLTQLSHQSSSCYVILLGKMWQEERKKRFWRLGSYIGANGRRGTSSVEDL